MLRIFLTLVLGLSLVNCTGQNFNRKRSVDVEGNYFTRQFKQRGETIKPFNMISQLGDQELTKKDIQNFNFLFYTSLGLAFLGGLRIGDDTGTGLVLIGSAFGLGYLADQSALKAVDKHNNRFKRRRSEILQQTPMLFTKFEF